MPLYNLLVRETFNSFCLVVMNAYTFSFNNKYTCFNCFLLCSTMMDRSNLCFPSFNDFRHLLIFMFNTVFDDEVVCRLICFLFLWKLKLQNQISNSWVNQMVYSIYETKFLFLAYVLFCVICVIHRMLPLISGVAADEEMSPCYRFPWRKMFL